MNSKMMFTRSISGLASTIIIILLAERRYMSVSELCLWANAGDDNVRESVKLLGPEGLGICAVSVRARGEKFVGLAEGYQGRLPGLGELFSGSEKSEPESGTPALVLVSDSEKSEPEIEKPAKVEQKSAPNAILEPKNTPDSEKSEPEICSIRLIDDESESLNKTEIINQSEHKNSEKLPDVSVVLENLSMLFGDTLTVKDIPADTKPYLLLAWVAKLYQDMIRPGSKLKNPCGVLRLRLAAKQKLRLHLDKLPDDFLHAIGLHVERPQENARINVLDDLPDYQAERAEREREKHQRLEAIPDDIRSAWEIALETMRQDMPRSQFECWVEPTRVIGWDGNILEVGARSEYAVKWLSMNLLDVCNRVLADVGLQCTVQFLAVEEP